MGDDARLRGGPKRRDPRVRPWTLPVVWLASILALGTTAWLAVVSVLHPPVSWVWLNPTEDNWFLPSLLIGSTAAAVAAFWGRRRGARLRPEAGVGASLVITIVLGVAAYSPCAAGHSFATVAVWILNLFVGQIEASVITPTDPDACSVPLSLTLELARLFGLSTLVFGALAVASEFLQAPVDRGRARMARSVDLMVGLDADTFPLVEALVAERDRARRRPGWYDLRFRDVWGLLTWRRSTVVVLHPTGAGPLVAEARALGVLVYVGSPTDERAQARITKRWLSTTSLNRLFAVTPSQQTNVEVITTAQSLLPISRADWLSRGVIPRLIARFSDARDARAWRLRGVATPGCFTDALNLDELLARTLVERLVAFGATNLVVAGDTPLTVALLDEVALQRAFRDELAGGLQAPADSATRVLVDEVTLVAETAEALAAEWQAHAAPAAESPRPLVLRPTAGVLEDAVADLFAADPGRRVALVVTGRPSPLTSARSLRLNRAHGGLLVMRPSANVHGVESLTGLDGTTSPGDSVLRFGPTITEDGYVPEDSWTVLARQEHEVYCKGHQPDPADERAARRPWPRTDDDPERTLPRFFREDSLRQHRNLLMLVESLGYRWEVTQASDPAGLALDADELTTIARGEHERWCELRRRTGWRASPPPPSSPGKGEAQAPPEKTPEEKRAEEEQKRAKEEHKRRDERARQNANLATWDDGQLLGLPGRRLDATALEGLRDFNIDLTTRIIKRLRVWGIAPAPGRYERIGTVRATELATRRDWTSSAGDRLTSQPGDYWVVDHLGQGRGVARDKFLLLHAPTGEPGTYRRVGTVSARRAVSAETVTSLEGEVAVTPGMWVLTDDEGDTWAVAHDYFVRHYRPADQPRRDEPMGSPSVPARHVRT